MPVCGCDTETIRSAPPYANAQDVRQSLSALRQCCKGVLPEGSEIDVGESPGEAMQVAFPTGFATGTCECEVLWIVDGNGDIWFSGNHGVTFRPLNLDFPDATVQLEFTTGTIPNGTPILWNTELLDTTNFWTSTFAGRITVPYRGVYKFMLRFGSPETGGQELPTVRLRVINDSTQFSNPMVYEYHVLDELNLPDAGHIDFVFAGHLALDAGDIVRVFPTTTYGGSPVNYPNIPLQFTVTLAAQF